MYKPELYSPQQCRLCKQGHGYLITQDKKLGKKIDFADNSIGYLVRKFDTDHSEIFFPGLEKTLAIADNHIETFNPQNTGKPKTGEEFAQYICNICFVLKPKDDFQINQKDAQGRITRRPSCQTCRTQHIEKKEISNADKQIWEQLKPRKGSLFQCPICKKYSISEVNARLVLDHDHTTGKVRGYLCDSCNTGLGRFKNGTDLLNEAIEYVNAIDSVNSHHVELITKTQE